MTKFQKICEAAKTARSNHQALQTRSWSALSQFLNGYIAYCEIPRERIEYLKWNGIHGDECAFTPGSEDGRTWLFPGAIVFDEENESWILGILLKLSNKGHFPENWVSFAVCTTEWDGMTQMKIGFNEPFFPWSPQDEGSRHKFYDYINDKILKGFTKPGRITESATKTIGFKFSSIDAPDESVSHLV